MASCWLLTCGPPLSCAGGLRVAQPWPGARMPPRGDLTGQVNVGQVNRGRRLAAAVVTSLEMALAARQPPLVPTATGGTRTRAPAAREERQPAAGRRPGPRGARHTRLRHGRSFSAPCPPRRTTAVGSTGNGAGRPVGLAPDLYEALRRSKERENDDHPKQPQHVCGEFQRQAEDDDPLAPLHEATLCVDAERVSLCPDIGHQLGNAQTAMGTRAAWWPKRSWAYHAKPTKTTVSLTRVARPNRRRPPCCLTARSPWRGSRRTGRAEPRR